MYYSSFGILSLILHVIINWEILRNGRKKAQSLPDLRYYQFLVGLILFFSSDILWGLFYETRIVPLAYTDTVIFFFSMVLSVLLWTRFVVVYLDKKGPFSTFLMYAGWTIFTYVILNLVINFFYPIVFGFDSNGEYLPGHARYIALGLQFLLFLTTSVYTFSISATSEGKEKIHHRAVGFSGLMMTIFIVLQEVFPLLPCYAIGCLIGTCFMHIFVEEDKKTDRDRESRIFNQIAESLSDDYDAIYYFNIDTGRYIEFARSELHDAIKISNTHDNFFKDAIENTRNHVHPDDRDFADGLYYKEAILKNLEGRKTYSYKYRMMVQGESRYFRFSLIRANDEKHFILCEKDIQDIVTAETARRENQKKHITFDQIAESLASNYDVIYYIDVRDGSYIGYTSNNIYGQLEVRGEGEDFFEESKKNLEHIIHIKDKDRVFNVLDKDYLLSMLEDRKEFDIDYRLIIDGKSKYTRMSIRKPSDGVHFIIGVENIDDEVRKEKEHLKALNTEKELARRDELTGTKNKTAYTELENSVQSNIDNGIDYMPFAIGVFDINDLKIINDTEGHKAGDEYIKAAAKLLCTTFAHSPVFRIGGDEFAIFLRGDDYDRRNDLINELKKLILNNRNEKTGPVIAVGMSEFKQGSDTSIEEVFDRADTQMYENKRELKAS